MGSEYEATADQHHDDHDHHGAPSGIKRWLFSTNHKDIGTMYLTFAVVFGIVGALMSVVFRMELARPGTQIMQWLLDIWLHTGEMKNLQN